MRDEKVNRVGVIVQAVKNGHNTSRKVAEATGLCRTTAHDYLQRLTSAGKLTKQLGNTGRYSEEFVYQAVDTEPSWH